jgi:hypothetical protein
VDNNYLDSDMNKSGFVHTLPVTDLLWACGDDEWIHTCFPCISIIFWLYSSSFFSNDGHVLLQMRNLICLVAGF